jgi:hypothetical protein
MFCHKCGNEVLPQAAHCHSCGTSVVRVAHGRPSLSKASEVSVGQPSGGGASGNAMWFVAIGVGAILGLLFGITWGEGLSDGHSHRVHWLAGLAIMLGGKYGLGVLFAIVGALLTAVFTHGLFERKAD